MLTDIHIQNYTIAAEVDLELAPGMTVITGETGAGKSIILDALGLCLGDRADTSAVRPGCDRAEITATFSVADVPDAKRWLLERDLAAGDECLLRRVITREGRSKAYINGRASTLADCAALGHMLIDIHSQHAHQSLLRRDTQRQLLDASARAEDNAARVAELASLWQQTHQRYEQLKNASEEHSARQQLLSYQVEELDELAFTEGEYTALSDEQQQLANAEEILHNSHRALEQCDSQHSAVQHTLALLPEQLHNSKAAAQARELLESAAIALSEAKGELQAHLDSVDINPERLQEVEQRLQQSMDLSRKHRVKAEQIPALHQQLAEELTQLSGSGQQLDELEAELDALHGQYLKAAKALSQSRQRAAQSLRSNVEAELAKLAMEHCQFLVQLTPKEDPTPSPQGLETVEFLIATHPGASPGSLAKIASGGELSRIGLAIGVVTASASQVPTRVFDEVDVGIGGATSEVVGRMLRTLAQQSQILCVTHLAQVAAQGHQHLQVTREGGQKRVSTHLKLLNDEERVAEIARMAGGLKITDKHLAHARELLAAAG
ncbi:MAG: DNA repair protein RecN [Gammaproteobacteria bacterium]|nr:MAG: DNA repair protein RecN [Gammaproteobacteria bacterium]